MNTSNNFNNFYNYVSRYFIGDDVIKLIYVGINAARRSNTIPAFLLRGPPGAGKTMITKVVADYLNANYIFIQATLNTTEDELIYKYIPSENTKSGVKIQYGPLPDALIKSREKTTVIVIDEFDKTRPSADALLLDYLQNARVSFRIDDKEDVITGNKDNLIVFITSNDNREFSEPLLRRVITIDFKLPDPQKVEQLLRKHFDDEKIIKTLATIYMAGLETNLSKPITIQELIQLGYAMTVLQDVDFNQLLLSFVVKNVDDLHVLDNAMQNLQPQPQQSQQLPNVVETLVNTIQKINDLQMNTPTQQPTTQQNTVQQLLSSINVIKPEVTKVTPETIIKPDDEVTTHMFIADEDLNAYTEVITRLDLPPSDRPDVLGKFKVVMDEKTKKLVITSEQSLTFDELHRLYYANSKGEFYAEDYVVCHGNYITGFSYNSCAPYSYALGKLNEGIDNMTRIYYYTKNLIIIGTTDDNLIIRLEYVKPYVHKVMMYVNNKNISNNNNNKYKGVVGDIISNYDTYSICSYIKDNIRLGDIKYTVYNNGKKELNGTYEGVDSDIERFRSTIDRVDGVLQIQIIYAEDYRSSSSYDTYRFGYECNTKTLTIKIPNVEPFSKVTNVGQLITVLKQVAKESSG